ncbi:MAG TPA: M15 family metallopeptidase [Candidatus Limnocylindrales bacterium]|nr:M15 family metallopeptidase [Candidatus Limnocylindrales bacterium]
MRTLKLLVVGLVIVAATIGVLVYRSEPSAARSPGGRGAIPLSVSVPAPRLEVPRPDGAVTTRDGELPDGATVFDEGYPGIANLDPDLLRALRAAATEADEDGIALPVNSGWRSPDYQNELLRQAVSQYGSAEEAAKWVATAETSPHVSGEAIDIGSVDGWTWLSKRGAEFGLCQIYRNEPWHFELRPGAREDGHCPRMFADPTDDPRMHG